jgi:hypothetical protein
MSDLLRSGDGPPTEPRAAPWGQMSGAVARLSRASGWRRSALAIALIVIVQAAVLTVTYRAVVFHGHTLLTGASEVGEEGSSPPYGYPGPAPTGWNDIDAGASAWFLVPQIEKAHLELSSGQLPLWNANVLLGAPLAASAQGGILNPLTWPLVASPTTGTWDAWLLIRLLMAGLLCTLLAWYLGLRLVPATLAGLIFMMSGAFQLRTTTIQTGIMAILPLAVMGAEMCLRRPSRLSSGVLAIAVAASILFGMPEESLVCLGFVAVYFVVRFVASWLHEREFPRARALYAACGGAAVGVCLSLPLLVPFAEYAGLSYNTHSGGGAGLVHQTAQELAALVGPHWNIVGPHWMGLATGQPVDNWFGVGTVLLAVLGLGRSTLPRGVRVLLVVTAVAVEAKLLGFPGWYNQFVGSLPVISNVSLWEYASVIVSLPVALLAGAGLQRLHAGSGKAWHVAVGATAVAALVAAAAPAYLTGTPIRWSQIALTGAILIVVTAGALLATRPVIWPRRAGLVAAAGGVVLELILLASPEVPLPLNYDPLAPTPTTAYLQRVDPSGVGRTYSADAILYPDTSEAFDLDDIRDLDALYIKRSYEYLKLFVAPDLTDRFDGLEDDAAQIVGNPFFNVLNVEYVLVAPPIAENAATLPASQFQLETITADGVGIYRNLDASPRAQVVFDVTKVDSESAATSVMQGSGFDPTRQAVIEASGSMTVPTNDDPPVMAAIVKYQDDEVVMRTDTAHAGTLVLADAYYPGWQAQVDGKAAPIYPADLALRGVMVPAGIHTVVMRYQPGSFTVGALGVPAGVALFLAGGWGVPVVVRLTARRRPRRAASGSRT